MARRDRSGDEEVYRAAEANRLLAADMFAGLTPEQWRTPSLCAGWTVREVAAHLLSPLLSGVGLGTLLVEVIRHRGDLDALVDAGARKVARLPTEEIVAGLRERASRRLDAPVVGPRGPATDTAVHLRDAARPLGLDVCPPPDAWRPSLDFLVSPQGVRGFVPKGRTDGLRVVVDDQDWSWGAGAELRGSSEAVAMAVSGRRVALADLTGPGVDLLRSRLDPE